MLISVCIPVYNAAHSIAGLVEEVAKALKKQAVEFVLVNDGSKDESDAVCTQLAGKRKDLTYICLRRNFGEHNAVMCALSHCSGDCAVIIDDDFQNPPSEIMKLITELAQGYDGDAELFCNGFQAAGYL